MNIREIEKIREENIDFQELHYSTAHAFTEHLKKLLVKHRAQKIQLAKRDLYKDIEYSEDLLKKLEWLGIDYLGEPHICAAELGLIEIDSSIRPYAYSLNNNATLLLRPYQYSIAKTVQNSQGSVLVEAPTGAGKSVIACEIAKNEIEKGGIVLIVAPKIILLEQLQKTFNNLKPQTIHGPKDYDATHSIFISTLQTAHKRELGFEPTMIMIDEVHFGFSGKMIKMLLDDFTGRLIGLSANLMIITQNQ